MGGQPQGPDWGDMKDKMMAARGPDRMILIAGILFFIDSFLPWAKSSFGIINVNVKGWSSEWTAVLSILFALAALLLAAARMGGMNAPLPAKDGVLYLVFGGGAFVFALLRLLTLPAGVSAGFGLWIALVLGVVLAYAGYMKYKAST